MVVGLLLAAMFGDSITRRRRVSRPGMAVLPVRRFGRPVRYEPQRLAFRLAETSQSTPYSAAATVGMTQLAGGTFTPTTTSGDISGSSPSSPEIPPSQPAPPPSPPPVKNGGAI
jgi:hypothetical protein